MCGELAAIEAATGPSKSEWCLTVLQLIKQNLWVLSAGSCYWSFSQANSWRRVVLPLFMWKHTAVLQRGKLMETESKYSENPVKTKTLQEIIQEETMKASIKWVLHHFYRGLSLLLCMSGHFTATQKSPAEQWVIHWSSPQPGKSLIFIQLCSGHVPSHPHCAKQTLSYWFKNDEKAHFSEAGRK